VQATELRFLRNSIVANQGHPAEYLYLLVQGRARFFLVTDKGQKIILHWIVPGQVFGASAVTLDSSTYLVGTETTRDSVVLSWKRSDIRNLVARFPQLMENMFSICEEYLEWYVAAHEVLTTHNAKERLAHLLARLSQSIGEPISDGISIDIRNEELANTTNLTVYTVSRQMREWQHAGAITKRRNKVVVRSLGLLLVAAGKS
jgi:CRP/FNR family transcriptional regulator, nitrogen oxide reductase regulator